MKRFGHDGVLLAGVQNDLVKHGDGGGGELCLDRLALALALHVKINRAVSAAEGLLLAEGAV